MNLNEDTLPDKELKIGEANETLCTRLFRITYKLIK